MNFQDKIKEKLGDYKNKHFISIPNGKWRNSVKDYPHILPKIEGMLNLLPKYKISLIEYMEKNRKTLKPHTYFHHLNSSQAMCLNFFYPLLKEKELELVLDFIGFKNEKIKYDSCFFEKKSEIEKVDKQYRPTFFDFFIETKTGKKIFFEIKYTEQEFAKTKQDVIHIQKFANVYKHRLDPINKEYCNEKSFLNNYQILRNLICVSENSYVVFIYPDGNKKVKSQAEFAKSSMLNSKFKNNLINLTWEDLITYTEKNCKNLFIKEQLKDFKEKYIS